jgi:hypothetical protein
MWRSGGIAPLFITSALGGDEWSASRSVPFTTGKKPLVSTVYVKEKRKISCPCQESNPDFSAVQPVA